MQPFSQTRELITHIVAIWIMHMYTFPQNGMEDTPMRNPRWFAIPTLVFGLCLASVFLYEGLDFLGTSFGFWQGNTFSVRIADGLHVLLDTLLLTTQIGLNGVVTMITMGTFFTIAGLCAPMLFFVALYAFRRKQKP